MEPQLKQFQPIDNMSIPKFRLELEQELLIGIFFNYSTTLMTHQKIRASGYCNRDISLAMTAETWQKQFLNTWEKEATAQVAKNEDFPHNGIHGPHCHTTEIKTLINSSHYVPGLDVLIAGPMGHLIDKSHGNIINVFHKWGLPKILSEQFEKVVLCGGILIGVASARIAKDCLPMPNGYEYMRTHVRLISSSGSICE